MKDQNVKPVKVSDSIGSVSVALSHAKKPNAVLLLAHGAGADMHHPFMKSLAEGLAGEGIEVLRYNFPFTEQKKKRPDVPAVAIKTVEAICRFAHERYPELPVFVGGKSFGGRMSSHALAKECPVFVAGLVFYGYPLHAPGKPSVDRAAHLGSIACPMLFLQGTKDTLATWNLIESVVSGLPNASLVKFDGADHSFKAGKSVLMSDLVRSTGEWLTATLQSSQR